MDYLNSNDVQALGCHYANNEISFHPLKDTDVQLYGKGDADIVTFKRNKSYAIIGRSRSDENEFIVKIGDNKYAKMTFDMSRYNRIFGTPENSYYSKADYLARGTHNGAFSFDSNGSDINFNQFMKDIDDSNAALENADASGTTGAADNAFSNTSKALTPLNEQIVMPSDPMSSDIARTILEPTIRSYGIPPQWTKYVDPRIGGFEMQNTKIKVGLGRRYTGVTISNPTILELAPGYIKYSNWLDGTDLADLANDFTTNQGESAAMALVSRFAEHGNNFYSIQPCFGNNSYEMGRYGAEDRAYKVPGYITYVNVLMGVAAVFLSRVEEKRSNNGAATASYNTKNYKKYTSAGVAINLPPLSQRLPQNITTAQSYSQMDWIIYDKPTGYLTIGGKVIGSLNGADSDDTSTNAHGTRFDYLRFYLSGSTSSTDEFSTSIDESTLGTLASTLNVALKETAYWLGSVGGSFLADVGAGFDKVMNSIPGNPLAGIFSIGDLIGGAKLVFPKIITDSQYGKSISCECTFPSIYGDEEAIYLNTFLSYLHLLAFVLPHQVASKLEMYTFPFLVKAFCRGLFNTELGAITSFSVNRGGNDNALWSFNGPAEIITVNFEITPLINNLVMTSTRDNPGWLLKNKGLQEYMSSIAAFDARNDQYELAIELFSAMLSNHVSAKISGILSPLLQSEFITDLREIIQRVEKVAPSVQSAATAALSEIAQRTEADGLGGFFSAAGDILSRNLALTEVGSAEPLDTTGDRANWYIDNQHANIASMYDIL